MIGFERLDQMMPRANIFLSDEIEKINIQIYNSSTMILH